MSANGPPVQARLRAVRPGKGGPLTLHFLDEYGNEGAGVFDPARTEPWKALLQKYVENVNELPAGGLIQIGRAVFEATIGQEPLLGCWRKMRSESDGRPVHLTVEFGDHTHPLAALPLELLYETDRDGFLFAESDHALVRALLGVKPQEWSCPERPRVVFAWACPPMTGDRFTGDRHLERLRTVFADVEPLARVTRDGLRDRLARAGVDYLVLLAHGESEDHVSSVALGNEAAEYLDATELAGLVKGSGARLVFLCSCQTGKPAADPAAGLFSGMAQRMLREVSCVVAMQANLPIARSAELTAKFFELLGEGRTPAEAVAQARGVYQRDSPWSVPVVYARPRPWQSAPDRTGRAGSAPGHKALVELPPLPFTRAFKGRDHDLKRLDDAWVDPGTNVIAFHGWGGVGKTALVGHWLARMAAEGYRGAEAVYGYSFEGAAGDAFIERGLRLFGDPAPTEGPPEEKGRRLAELVRQRRALLWLDGFQSVQDQEGEVGRIKSPALRELVCALAARNPGLCVIGTRQPILDLTEWAPTAPSVELGRLSRTEGADLLRELDVFGPPEELERAADEVHGHALSLNLLGSYLKEAWLGDVARREEFRFLDEELDPARQAKRIMEPYERLLAEKHGRALALLRLVSLFSRPAKPEAIRALLAAPAVEGLTNDLVGIREPEWNRLVAFLRKLKLLDEAQPGSSPQARAILDAHPLVREYFAEGLARARPGAFQKGHARLSRFFRASVAKREPATSEEMGPLYLAVIHGCQAGAYDDAFENVYWPRIKRGGRAYNTKELHAYIADLKVLAPFFESCWDRFRQGLAPLAQARLLYAVAFDLRAIGRLQEAVRPMDDCLRAWLEQKAWNDAAQVAGDLSLLYITLGQLGQAIEPARQAMDYADWSECPFERVRARSNLTNALLQGGRLEDALDVFEEAEKIVAADAGQPDPPPGKWRPTLKSYWFYELHLDSKQYSRVKQLVELPQPARTYTGMPKLDNALARLARARACMGEADALVGNDPGSNEARGKLLDEALGDLGVALVEMDEAKTEHHRPRVLLARAALFRRRGDLPRAKQDLATVRSIAERFGMAIHLTDALIEEARLHLALGQWAEAREPLRQARERVDEMEYERRRPEVEELARRLAVEELRGSHVSAR